MCSENNRYQDSISKMSSKHSDSVVFYTKSTMESEEARQFYG